ncbi:kinesin-like protein KIN-7N isoform X1 [Nicotiana tabacum]|uniref:Kinesin-like protein KIN-7N isoform X1 n=1 Tax=Nicotiana tabacum TaxID=4097 RepID=A0A1S3YVZ1_TOBAC|nr:PREDICTED: kinesin-related protein 11-like isoform X1 [Nicotiana tabacum]
MEKVCVAVRVRPARSNEENYNGTFWKVEDNRISLHKSLGTPISGASYTFDHVFDQDCSNARVYDLLTKDIIHAALEGFNGTAFAYGQTSSGKTFTMNGTQNDPGVIQRAVNDIFQKIEMTTNREFLIRVSYMEIYNEEINDLFAVENQKLQIHESLDRGVFVAGLREEIVNDAEQVLELIQQGEVNRHFGETNMNVRSSRSHTIFRMVIESKGKHNPDDAVRVSILNLVDLAGSERIAKTGAGGVRLKEGKHINKSLMILGNVINKLSEGVKLRVHIPYRDSKLTRILQPALGGNAITSIICTVAPEEIHVEESKGTLQFASRAKRITNCVQVNEILTDAALLKRQTREIEELRMKLQGSHSEVLEQEILKLRNDLLKYEHEREKLAMELEEERRSQKEREQCILEQQKKIHNLSNLASISDSNGHATQNQEESSSSITCQEDAFSTPCLKPVPSAFVAKRSQRSQQLEYSPVPDAFSNFADEDTWMKINKGFVVDLDSLHMTPSIKVQSSLPNDENDGLSTENYKQEAQNLRRQLELVLEERDELRRHHTEQESLNEQLMSEVSELQQEALLIHEIPQRLCESVTTCKDIYTDVLSVLQNFVANEKSATAKLLSTTSEIGTCLFATLESHFSVAMHSDKSSAGNNSSIEAQRIKLYDKLNRTISSLVLSEDENSGNQPLSSQYKDCTLGGEIACWKKKLDEDIKTIQAKYENLEKELDLNNQLLVASRDRYNSLEREFHLLKEERDLLIQKVSTSSEKLELVTNQKGKVWEDLNAEVKRRQNLEDEIKQFSVAFACRQRSIVSLHSDFKSVIGNFKSQKPISVYPDLLDYES